VITRLLTFELGAPPRALALFFTSLGKMGQYQSTPYLNARALAFLGVALACLIAARAYAKVKPAEAQAEGQFRFPNLNFARGLGVVAYLLLLIIITLDTRSLVLTLPDPSGLVGDPAGMRELILAYARALSEQATLLSLTTTLCIGMIGAATLGLGFGVRHAITRWLGLITLAFTILKLALFDIWALEQLFRVIVLFGVGMLLLAAGFLYARFGKRLISYFKVSGPSGFLLLLIPLLGALPSTRASAEGVDAPPPPLSAPLAEAWLELPGPGRFALLVEPSLARASANQGSFPDLRINAPDGKPCPYVLIPRGEAHLSSTRRASTLEDPLTFPNGASEAIFSLGDQHERHNQIQLQLEGARFMRNAELWVSEDRSEWGLLAEGVVWRNGTTRGPGVGREGTTLVYPTSAAPYLKLRLLPNGSDPAIAIRGAELHFLPKSHRRPQREIELPVVETGISKQNAKESFVRVELSEGGWPIDELLISVSEEDGAFERNLIIEKSLDGRRFIQIAHSLIRRSKQAKQRETEASVEPRFQPIRVPLDGFKGRHLRLRIQNADDPPLTIRELRGATYDRVIVIETHTQGLHHLQLGDPTLHAPRYELKALLAREAKEGSFELASLPLLRTPTLRDRPTVYAATSKLKAAADLPSGSPSKGLVRGLFIAGSTVLLFFLGLWAIKLLREAPAPPSAEASQAAEDSQER